MDVKNEMFSNNIRIIVFIIIVLSYIFFKILTNFETNLPASLVNITFGLGIPMTVMGMNLNALWGIKKSKELRSTERRRLIYFANQKANRLIRCIIFYVVIAIVVLVGSNFPIVSTNIKYVLPVVIATLCASVYSAIIAYRDMEKISDFEADIQDRANRTANKTKFQNGKSKSSST